MRGVVITLLIFWTTSTAIAQEKPSQNEAEGVRIVITKKGDKVEVQESIRLVSPTKSKEITIALPKNARNVRLPGDEQKGVRLEGNSVIGDRFEGAETNTIMVVYDLPIVGGSVNLRQQLGMNVRSLQVISTWTLDDTKLNLQGFGRASTHEILGGLEALIISANNIQDGHIQVKLTGLNKSPAEAMRIISMVISVVFLLGGLFFWIRKKMGSHD